MAGGYGYQAYPVRNVPDPRQVGQALMQPDEPDRGMSPPGEEMGETPIQMSGADYQARGHGDPAITQAIGGALTRLGNGYRGHPDPLRDRSRFLQDVMRNGVSPFEAHLLSLTGGG